MRPSPEVFLNNSCLNLGLFRGLIEKRIILHQLPLVTQYNIHCLQFKQYSSP